MKFYDRRLIKSVYITGDYYPVPKLSAYNPEVTSTISLKLIVPIIEYGPWKLCLVHRHWNLNNWRRPLVPYNEKTGKTHLHSVSTALWTRHAKTLQPEDLFFRRSYIEGSCDGASSSKQHEFQGPQRRRRNRKWKQRCRTDILLIFFMGSCNQADLQCTHAKRWKCVLKSAASTIVYSFLAATF